MITELTQQAIYFCAPSVFAETPSANTSDRYSFLSTREVLSNLSSHGYAVVDVKQSRGADQFHTRHAVTLAHRDHLQTYHTNEVYPRIVLINSHDGKTAYKMRAGLFRLICLNGMTVSEGFVPSVNIRHTGHALDEVLAGADTLRSHTDRVMSRVEDFKARELSEAEAFSLALLARNFRYGDERIYLVNGLLLNPRRPEDHGMSLWKVFNRVQENIIRGGFPVGRYPSGSYYPRFRRAKEVKAIDQLDRINTQLWEAAERLVLPN